MLRQQQQPLLVLQHRRLTLIPMRTHTPTFTYISQMEFHQDHHPYIRSCHHTCYHQVSALFYYSAVKITPNFDVIPDILQSDHMTSQMIYQIYTQRLTNEQHIFMQRVSNDYLLRSKHDRQAVDPSMSHLVYQFSRKSHFRRVSVIFGSPPFSLFIWCCFVFFPLFEFSLYPHFVYIHFFFFFFFFFFVKSMHL